MFVSPCLLFGSRLRGTDCKSVIRGFESHLGLAKTALALAPGPILRAACAARTRLVSGVQDAPQDALCPPAHRVAEFLDHIRPLQDGFLEDSVLRGV